MKQSMLPLSYVSSALLGCFMPSLDLDDISMNSRPLKPLKRLVEALCFWTISWLLLLGVVSHNFFLTSNWSIFISAHECVPWISHCTNESLFSSKDFYGLDIWFQFLHVTWHFIQLICCTITWHWPCAFAEVSDKAAHKPFSMVR